jgi:hypothetical protein
MPRVVEHKAESVVRENGFEIERRCDVLVARALTVTLPPCIAPFERLNTKDRRTHIGSGRIGPFADTQSQPMHRESVRTGGRLEIDIEVTAELQRGLTVDSPLTGSVAFERTSCTPEADCPTTRAERVAHSDRGLVRIGSPLSEPLSAPAYPRHAEHRH